MKTNKLFTVGLIILILMSIYFMFFWHILPERCVTGFNAYEMLYNDAPLIIVFPLYIICYSINKGDKNVKNKSIKKGRKNL